MKKRIITVITMFILLFIFLIYLGLLPLSIYSTSFRFWLLVLPLILVLPYILKSRFVYSTEGKRKQFYVSKEIPKITRFVFTGVFGLFLLFLLLNVISIPLFNAKRYQQIMNVNESTDFTTNINELSNTRVPIVDHALADRLGDKKLGESKGLGSQFTVKNYTLIEMNGELFWVGNLEYTGFFKWLNNRDEGVPGYIKISATRPSDVELVEYPMFYVPSAYFGQDLMRNIYFSGNMTKLFDDYTAFELDDEGHPYFVKTVLYKRFAFTKGQDTVGVAVIDAVSGEVNYYDEDDAPEWIDRIQPADIILQQLDYYGRYIHGYFNTLFAKKEVLQVSEGYSYLYNNGNFYLYTGLTSVGADESIVGFTLTDMRSKETTFYRIGGATEYSAQKSAEGAVQDLGYQANWPILINFSNIPTYFMTLKDDEGLIKKYAYVNVKDYSIVGIGNTLQEAQNNYQKNLKTSTTDPNIGGELKEVTGIIQSIKEVIIEGNSYYYILLENIDHQLFIAAYNISFEIPNSDEGDQVTITYYDTNTNVFTIETFDNHSYQIE